MVLLVDLARSASEILVPSEEDRAGHTEKHTKLMVLLADLARSASEMVVHVAEGANRFSSDWMGPCTVPKQGELCASESTVLLDSEGGKVLSS